ncbi:TPA: hypothetical protein NJ378_003697 [Vibrio parahaemolyticus]|nr:hypothetical protein [Vibrio parahaemolyticus]
MNEIAPTKPTSNELTEPVKETEPDTLFRYVKPSHQDGGVVKDEAFQLRENRSPPEEFLSMYYSFESQLMHKLRHVEAILKQEAGLTFSNNGGLLDLNVKEALEAVNCPNQVIEFIPKPDKTNKIGLHYKPVSKEKILEARTTLAFISNFYRYSEFKE